MFKYAVSIANILISATSASELFLSEPEYELAQVRGGFCQVSEGGWVYDLGEFDKNQRNDKKPAVAGNFQFKVCQPQFPFEDADGIPNNGSCADKAAAFMKDGSDCKYSFGQPEFFATRDEADAKELKSF